MNANSGYWTMRGMVGGTTVNIASGATIEVEDKETLNSQMVTGGADLTLNIVGKLVYNSFDNSLYDDADKIHVTGAGQLELTNGTLELGANTNFTGLTTVTNGRLIVFGDLGGSVNVGATGLLRIGGKLLTDSNGDSTLGTGGSAFGTVAGAIANNGSVVFDRSNAYTYGGIISGSGAVTKLGTGTLTLAANNTYTGATTLAAGSLVVNGNSASSGIATSANTSLVFNNTNAATVTGALTGSGAVSKTGAGLLTLSGASTLSNSLAVTTGSTTLSGSLTGNVTLANGTTLNIGTGGTSGSLTGNIANGGSVTFNRSDASTYAGVISGAGSLTKLGSGTLTLSAAQTFTGGTTVSTGSLVVGSALAGPIVVASGANLGVGSGAATASVGNVTNNGTVTFNHSDTATYSNVVSGTGGVVKTGTGTLTFGAVQTYTGGTTVSGGKLLLTTTLTSNTTVGAGGTLQIGNGGTTGSLVGNLVDNGTVIFDRSDDYSLAGNFSGTGSLIKRGAGKLTLDGVYTFSGTTTIEAGTVKITQLDASGALVIGSGSTVDLSGSSQTVGGLSGGSGSTINIDSGSLTINAPQTNTTTVYSGSLTGNGSLTVTGSGTTDLAGTNTYTGPTQVNGGTLKVNGSISSPTTVNTGGTLGGSGQINAPVNVASGGTLSPGNSPGTLTVAGNLTLAAGSTTIIEVDPTLTPNHDQINVTGGSATIATGAKLSVRPLGAISNYARTQTYTILTATGGISGTFAAGDVSSTMALLTPRLSYAANQVNLQLIRNDISFASLAGTSNQAAVGAAAEASGSGAAAFDSLIAQDQAGARIGYDALSGEAYGAVGSLLLNESRTARDTLLARAGDAKGRGAWLQVVDNTTTLDASANAASAKDQDFGLIGGGEAGSEALKFGFALGYGKSDISVSARASSADVETFHGGVYGGGSAGGFRYGVGLDYGQSSVEQARAIVFPSVSQSVRGNYDVTTTNVFGEVSYPAKLAGLALEPFAGLGHVQVKSDGFAETGGTLALNVAAQTRSVTTTVLGARLSGVWGAPDATTFYPRLSLAWQRASGDIEGTSTAAFGASAFTVVGASLPKNAALIDAGVGLNIWGSGKAWLSYSGMLSSEGASNGVKAGFAFNF